MTEKNKKPSAKLSTKAQKKGKHSLHDRLFKDIFIHQKYSLDLFKLCLTKKEFSLFAWNTLRTDMTTYVDKLFRELRADLIFSVCLKGSSKRVRIVFLLEHKSQYDPKIMRQLLSYQAEIYAKGGGAVIVFVIYTGKNPRWTGPVRFQDSLPIKKEKDLRGYFGGEILDFGFRLLNVRALKRGDLRDRGLTTGSILYIMSEIWDFDERKLLEFFRLTKGLSRRDKEYLIRAGGTYISKLDKRISWRMIQEAEEKVIKRKEDRVVTLVEEYMEELKQASIKKGLKTGLLKGRKTGHKEGLSKGLKTGLLKGRKEERRQVVLNMLKKQLDISMISEVTSLPKREISKLKNK